MLSLYEIICSKVRRRQPQDVVVPYLSMLCKYLSSVHTLCIFAIYIHIHSFCILLPSLHLSSYHHYYTAGEYRMDLPHGYGCTTYPSHTTSSSSSSSPSHTTSTAEQERYEGEYANGRRSGKGLYVYPSGARYEGDWVNGLQEGTGKYTYR